MHSCRCQLVSALSPGETQCHTTRPSWPPVLLSSPTTSSILLCLFVGKLHWECLGLTLALCSGGHSWQGLGRPHVVSRANTVAICKVGALPAELSLQSRPFTVCVALQCRLSPAGPRPACTNLLPILSPDEAPVSLRLEPL